MRRIILIDPIEDSREVLVRRLLAQGYHVDATSNPAEGADMALAAPPSAVIADLWMPSISGVQVCRLLRAETSTLDVPIILRGAEDDPKSRFWAERAGAAGYVRKGHMGALVRLLAKAALTKPPVDDFFIQQAGGTLDIRDRIARHLDTALFDSVIAAEVRALAASGAVDRLFDLFSQLVSQLVRYRWLALATQSPTCLGLHYHPHSAVRAEDEARAVFRFTEEFSLIRVEDEDAEPVDEGPEPLVFDVPFAGQVVGRIAIAPLHSSHDDADSMLRLVARELGGPLRMAALVDEQQRLAAIDPLTNLRNRRSFLLELEEALPRSLRGNGHFSLLLMDVDHFKTINDSHGHAGGDQVLVELGTALRRAVKTPQFAARWGGEEFVVALPNMDREGACLVAEEIRSAIEHLSVRFEGRRIPVTVSIGVADHKPGEGIESLIDRADRAMYSAKVAGRNRVVDSELSEAKPVLAPTGTS